MPFGKIPLNDGNEIPAIAFGTGTALYEKDATEYVERALNSGFTHIDTAQAYKNEASVGEALQDLKVDRSKVYITTKYGGGNIVDSFEASRKKLGVKHVDLYLIHTPNLVSGNLEGAWRTFEDLKKSGATKSIGVSNFTLGQIQDLLKIAKIKPSVNQIRFHPYNWADNKELLEFSNKHGIVTEAYSSLTPITKTPGGPVDSVLETIGLRLNATPAQVIFAWVKAKGVVIVTTSSKESRLEEYLAVGDLPDLSEAEIAAIDEAGAKGPPSRK